jgi:adenylate cyclase
MVLLLDEPGRNLYMVASRGFGDENVGAEVPIGEGQIGIAAQRCEVSRVDGISQMRKYSHSIRREYEERGVQQAREIPMPGLPRAQSRIVVPAIALGELVGVLVAESERVAAFDAVDEHILGVAASLVANAVGNARRLDREVDEPVPARVRAPAPVSPAGSVVVRYFASDASTFFDGDYLIKGVAGRILWSLLSQYVASGRTEFTNRELRLDPALELPGFKDNLESRLLLLKRRLDEREAPVRIEKTSRGRFCIQVNAQLTLEPAEQS